jgi:hypothetical protein
VTVETRCFQGNCAMSLQFSCVALFRRFWCGVCLSVLSCGTVCAADHSACCSAAVPSSGLQGSHTQHGQPVLGRKATGYVPRQNSAGERLSKIVLYFPTDAAYLVTVNGRRHHVQGAQMELSTSVVSRSGTVVTLEVRRPRTAEQQLVQMAKQAKSGVADEYEVGTEQLSLIHVTGLACSHPVALAQLRGGQTQLRLQGGQVVQLEVK